MCGFCVCFCILSPSILSVVGEFEFHIFYENRIKTGRYNDNLRVRDLLYINYREIFCEMLQNFGKCLTMGEGILYYYRDHKVGVVGVVYPRAKISGLGQYRHFSI